MKTVALELSKQSEAPSLSLKQFTITKQREVRRRHLVMHDMEDLATVVAFDWWQCNWWTEEATGEIIGGQQW